MTTHSHLAGVTDILKSSPGCQKNCLFTSISILQADSSKIQQTAVSKVVIKSINIMTFNISLVKKVMEFLWMPYRGPHMLTDSLLEDSHSKSSHIARFSNI